MNLKAPERVEEEPSARLGEVLSSEPGRIQPNAPAGGAEARGSVVEEAPASPALTSLSAFFSAAAAGFAAGGLFSGVAPRLVGIFGAVVGTSMVWLSYRTRRTALVQFMTIPILIALGIVLTLPDAKGAGLNLPSLVGDALRSGGIAQPPVPFDPGWRLFLVASIGMLAAASGALAMGFRRPRLATFLAVPVILGALAAQSGLTNLVPTVGALVLFVAGLTASYGVELASEGATSGGFELRRFAKGAAAIGVLVALLAGVVQFGFLFPEPKQRQVIPPKRPEPSPPERDRELFVVRADRQLPWRVGVLDVYDGRGWLTPPFDSNRLVRLPGTGRISIPRETEVGGEAVKVIFTVTDLTGLVIPGVANPDRVIRQGFRVEYDPRTQILRLPSKRPAGGITYTIEARSPPRALDLARVGSPRGMEEFLTVPLPPPEVADLLNQAPQSDLFTRLQFVREKLYEKVVAQGRGQPRDVPSSKVAALLAGKPGTPYEITAAEALLARWAGVPSRIGYGYFGGDLKEEGTVSVRPRHAATWLEVYFRGYGWVPIVGTPPRAQSSLSSAPKNIDPAIRPSENLTLLAYVPVKLTSIQLLYVIVQYWLVRVFPFAALAALVLWLYPGPLKSFRSWRRRQWGRRGGIAGRIRVAYAEFRDDAFDLNVGYPALTPIEFLSRIEEDKEHRELSWLVSRCIWGDLARDLRVEDAEIAEDLSRSVSRRLQAGHLGISRLLAYASRNSLRDPFTDEIPNLWWQGLSLRSRVGRQIGRVRSKVRRLTRRAAAVIGTILLVLLVPGCVRDLDLRSKVSAGLPPRLAPETLREFSFTREKSTEQAYSQAGPESLIGSVRVFTVRRDEEVVGALHVAAFKRAVVKRQREARAGVLNGLGGGQFELRRIGEERIYVQRLPELHMFLWFPTRGAYYELLVTRRDFESAGELFNEILAFQRGEGLPDVVVPEFDPRRGFD